MSKNLVKEYFSKTQEERDEYLLSVGDDGVELLFGEMTVDEYRKAKKEFCDFHSCPITKPIEKLNLIMKREFAEQIIRGEKTVEFRAYSRHYIDRLVDKDVCNFVDMHGGEPIVQLMFHDFINEVRRAKVIHFHNYNNSWYLDVECVENGLISCVKEEVEYLKNVHNSTELEEELEYYEKGKINERPYYFYFVVGNVLDTNIKI